MLMCGHLTFCNQLSGGFSPDVTHITVYTMLSPHFTSTANNKDLHARKINESHLPKKGPDVI